MDSSIGWRRRSQAGHTFPAPLVSMPVWRCSRGQDVSVPLLFPRVQAHMMMMTHAGDAELHYDAEQRSRGATPMRK